MNKFRQLCNPHQHPQSLDTASPMEAFVNRDIELGSGCSTMTDHGTLGAAVDFYTYCNKVDPKKGKTKIQSVIGLEAYLMDPDCSILKNGGITDPKAYNKYYHLTMHTKTESAYLALVKKLSQADLHNSVWAGQEKKPLFTWADCEELGAHDVTFCSSCLAGIVSNHYKNGRPDLGEAYYKRMRGIAKPGNFWVEVFPHVTTHKWTEGVFVTLTDGRILRYRDSKRFEVMGQEVPASLLHKYAGKTITGTYHYQKVEPLEPVGVIQSVKLVKDFVQDECSSFAPDGDGQLACNKAILGLAEKYGDKVLVSLDSHYATQDYRRVQDIKNLQAGWGPFFGNYHIYSSEEAFAYFSSKMGITAKTFEEWIDNSYEWADGFKDFKITKRDLLPRSRYPADTVSYAYELIEKHGRYDKSPAQKERLEKEITLFHDNGTQDLLPYFFTAEDFCAYYASKGYLMGSGRGSSGGVLLAYLLSITHSNPLKYNLSLDRFMTLDRIQQGKWPDIDTDFGRVKVLTEEGGYLDTFFKGRSAQISTLITMKLKTSIRDVFRQIHVGGIPYEVDRIAWALPDEPQGIKSIDFVYGYEDTDGNHIDGEIETNKDLAMLVRKHPKEWELIVKCLSTTKARSRHPSAYLLSDQDIDKIIPLTIQKDELGAGIVTQYTMVGCETVGGLKFDFLGLNTLNDIQDAIKLIQKRTSSHDWTAKDTIINGLKVSMLRVVPFEGSLYDIYDLPYSKEVFMDISEGRTETVFQLNTSAAQKWLKEFNYPKPDSDVKLINSIEETAFFTALDRPGPLDAFTEGSDGEQYNMLQEYARRARGIKNPLAIKIMQELLPETYGVMVTQEQLQSLYQKLTGCTGIEANNFRDKIGKKKMEEVIASKPFFIENASTRVSREDAEAIWGQIVTCGNYLFNYSHSINYSILAYSCAFLKRWYPTEWWCAVLGNADKTKIFEEHWSYVKDMVVMPDINQSQDRFVIREDNKVVAPLEFLKGVGDKAHTELCASRPFASLDDFCQKIEQHKVDTQTIVEVDGVQKIKAGRSAINVGVVSSLILTGAMDTLFEADTDLYEKLDAFSLAQARAQTPEGAKKPKKPKPITTLEGLSPIGIYQKQKSILPIYTQDLIPRLGGLGIKEITCMSIKHSSGKDIKEYNYEIQRPDGVLQFPFVTAEQFLSVSKDTARPCPISVAMIGYVMEDSKFSWKDKTTGKQKEAFKLTFEVEGRMMKFVRWGNPRSGKLENYLMNRPDGTSLEGSVVILLLQKWTPGKDFSANGIYVVQDALKTKEEKD